MEAGLAFQIKDFKSVIEITTDIVKKDPSNIAALEMLFFTYYELTQYTDAIGIADKILDIYPASSVWANRAICQMVLFKFEDALVSANKSVELDPNNSVAYNTRGNIYKALNRYDQALDDYKKSRELNPEPIETDLNFALLYTDILETDCALEEFGNASKKNPHHPEIAWNKSLLLLKIGNYDDGWHLYESRWQLPRYPKPANITVPVWDGLEELTGKTVLVFSEQGFGDTIMFSRYIANLVKLGANVVLEVEAEVSSLFKKVSGVTKIVKKGIDRRPPCDLCCPLLSLPYKFKTIVETIPPALKLKADPKKVVQWKQYLGPKKQTRIGIVWSGKAGFATDFKRSLSFEQFIKALPVGPEYICLQKEIKETDKKSLKTRKDVKIISNKLKDFSDTAALIECLDLVISTETSVPVLSATLGVETWIVIQHSMEWRWLEHRTDTPWFPAAKLYRQPTPTSGWDPVLSTVRGDIEKLNSST
jgi:tetratricopeptide (TPR) repeat protein